MNAVRISADRLLPFLVFSWGFCAFFPVGVAYAHFLLVSLLVSVRGGLVVRLAATRQRPLFLPMALFGLWTLFALAAGDWYADSSTRLFHVIRVLLLLALGMVLTPREARSATLGFLCGAICAASIVALHHVFGLPPWDIWASLLMSRNNKSSANMIMMAIAAGLFFYHGLRDDPAWFGRRLSWAAALALGMTVALHSVSRNAQLLLPILATAAILCHYRRWRAILAALVVVAVMTASALQWSPATQSRFQAAIEQAQRVVSQSDYTTGVGERWHMASEAWRGMVAHPVLGTGVGSWLPRWKAEALKTGGGLNPQELERHVEINNPHNDYLLTGMETGIPGLLIMLWLLAAFVLRGWQNRSVMGDSTVMLAISVAAMAMINAPLRDAALGMTILWLLGASVAGHERSAGPPQASSHRSPTGRRYSSDPATHA